MKKTRIAQQNELERKNGNRTQQKKKKNIRGYKNKNDTRISTWNIMVILRPCKMQEVLIEHKRYGKGVAAI